MILSVGETLQAGKYRLDALLDQHDWGSTFLATYSGLDQPVVIKTYQATGESPGPSVSQAQSFLKFGQSLTRFHHPNLSRVVSIFEEADTICMVSEFIEGTPLSQFTRIHPLAEVDALKYIRQIALGLKSLHRHGLLHLNLRPSRILKRKVDQTVVLIGLNSRFSGQTYANQVNPYLAPEQCYPPGKISLSTEVYGIAATLYALVTGEVPTAAKERYKTPLKPPRQCRQSLSKSMEQAILSGMALDPCDRPQLMTDWLALLPQTVAPSPPTPQLQAPPAWEHPPGWEVRLPAFSEAGISNVVTKIITPAEGSSFRHSATAQKQSHSLSSNAAKNLQQGLDTRDRIVTPSRIVEQAQFDTAAALKKNDPAEPAPSEFDSSGFPENQADRLVNPKDNLAVSVPLSDAKAVLPSSPNPQNPATQNFLVEDPLPHIQKPEALAEQKIPDHSSQPSPAKSTQSPLPQPAEERSSTSTFETLDGVLSATSPSQTPTAPSEVSQANTAVISPAAVHPIANDSPNQTSSDMVATPTSNASQFPKWTLFWCALIAACGGLGAGLWFRVQIAKQFATPASQEKSSSFQNISPNPKEEQFLPTSTSVIPEENLDAPRNSSSETGLDRSRSESSSKDPESSSEVNPEENILPSTDPSISDGVGEVYGEEAVDQDSSSGIDPQENIPQDSYEPYPDAPSDPYYDSETTNLEDPSVSPLDETQSPESYNSDGSYNSF